MSEPEPSQDAGSGNGPPEDPSDRHPQGAGKRVPGAAVRLVMYAFVLFFAYSLLVIGSPVPFLGALTPLVLPILWILVVLGTNYFRLIRARKSLTPTETRARAILFGEAIVLASILSALTLQAQYATNPDLIDRPELAVWLSPGPAARIIAVTEVRSIYRTCDTTTVLTLRLDDGSMWSRDRIVSVGTDGYPGQTVELSWFDLDQDVAPPARLNEPGRASSVYRIGEAPPTMRNNARRDLRVIVEADWGSPRAFGSCTIALPRLISSPSSPSYAESNAKIGADGVGVDPSSGRLVETAENRIARGYNVLRQDAYPPPVDQTNNRWRCTSASASADAGTECDTIVPVEDPVANNIRAALTLLAGTALAFGVQFTFDAYRR